MVPQTFRWTGRLGPLDLEVSDSTFQPSTISVLLADALEVHQGDEVIDVGCGSGILSIIAAKLGALRVFGMDTAPDVVGVASRNAARHGVADTVTFLHGDLFAPLSPEVRADVIIGDVSGIPDSLAVESGWFPSAPEAGPRGSGLPIRCSRAARERLAPEGVCFSPPALSRTRGRSCGPPALYGKITQAHRTSDPASPRPRRDLGFGQARQREDRAAGRARLPPRVDRPHLGVHRAVISTEHHRSQWALSPCSLRYWLVPRLR